jgi:hypothetical protein
LQENRIKLSFSRLASEFLLAVVEEVGIEVLTTKMGITGGSLDGEDTTLDVEERHIESTATKIVDENVALLGRLARAETVGNGSSGRLVDDTENVHARDGTGILGSLALVVVKVGGHSDDSLLNLLAELHLSNLLHLHGYAVSNGKRPFDTALLTLVRTMAEISWGEKEEVLPRYSTSTLGLPLPSSTTLKGHDSMSFLTVGSSKRRPIRRLLG